MTTRLTAWVQGHVQGVGFRWWARACALDLGLVGRAINLDDGRVEVVVEGTEEGCRRMLALLTEHPSTSGRPGVVRGVTQHWSEPPGDATTLPGR